MSIRPLLSHAPAATALLATVVAGGCDTNAPYMTPDRLEKGLVVILPGIEGESGLERRIRESLLDSGCDRAIAIWNWGRPIPLVGVVINQLDILGNRIAGAEIAKRIRDYHGNFPGRPVHAIGRGGGGAVAVFVAEAIGKDEELDGVILLSPSISSAYDLTDALRGCRNGIVNLYSTENAILVGVSTLILGTADGAHGLSAGVIGFDEPGNSASKERREAYARLYQIPVEGLAGYDYSATRPSTTDVGLAILQAEPPARQRLIQDMTVLHSLRAHAREMHRRRALTPRDVAKFKHWVEARRAFAEDVQFLCRAIGEGAMANWKSFTAVIEPVPEESARRDECFFYCLRPIHNEPESIDKNKIPIPWPKGKKRPERKLAQGYWYFWCERKLEHGEVVRSRPERDLVERDGQKVCVKVP